MSITEIDQVVDFLNGVEDVSHYELSYTSGEFNSVEDIPEEWNRLSDLNGQFVVEEYFEFGGPLDENQTPFTLELSYVNPEEILQEFGFEPKPTRYKMRILGEYDPERVQPQFQE